MLRLFKQPLGTVNESSGFALDVSVLDAGGTASQPSTLEWRLLCVSTDATLQNWTAITPTLAYDANGAIIAVTAELSIPGTLNALQTSGLAQEEKAVIVVADRGLATEWSTEGQYFVVRLQARS